MKKLNQEIFKNQRFLFVFDLDGTLLNEKKTISPLTASILKELESLGNVVTIASGRAKRAIYPYYHELGLKGPFICYNGALVTSPDNPDYPEKKIMIPKEIIKDFFTHFKEETFVNAMIENETDQYYLKTNKAYTFFFHPEGMNVHEGSIADKLNHDVLTMVIENKDTSRNKEIEDYVSSRYENIGMRFWLDAPQFGELYHYQVNKSTSIDIIAKEYGIDCNHIVCFGDAMNDFEMIGKAGISFAMKNGADPLKEAASYVTEYDNDHEGIYYALLSLFGIEE